MAGKVEKREVAAFRHISSISSLLSSDDEFVLCICTSQGYWLISRRVRETSSSVENGCLKLAGAFVGFVRYTSLAMDHSDGDDFSAYYHRQPNGRVEKKKRQIPGNGFTEFPTQMTTPTITTSRRESQSRIRFAEDTKPPQSSGPMRELLVLGPCSSERQNASSPLQANSLDFSMIATPGGGKQAMRNYTNTTPSDNESQSAISSGIWPAGTPFTNLLRGVVSSNTPNAKSKKLTSATPYTAARETLDDGRPARTFDESNSEFSALTFARSAPLSGYLRKLGKNIPTFKRRFFVLKPSTHLYYFLSPTDIEPRGCIDLDLGSENGGCEVREIGVLPDGTFRFELLFDDEMELDGETNHKSTKQSIILEARTEEIGREWMNKLQSERLSTARDEIDMLRTALAEVKATSSSWEKVAAEEEIRADEAEKQRDMIQSEATVWEGKFNDLNEAVGLLEKHIAEGRSDSLAESLDRLNLNDSNFYGASEAIDTIHNDYKLACETAEQENTRAAELEKKLKEAESRLSKAEAELSQVWQDNCAIRKELKKSKREKKILIREVKAQRAKSSDDSQKNQDSVRPEDSCASTDQSLTHKHGSNCGDSETVSLPLKPKFSTEQQRLVIELEEHVMSGLRLSEQFLTLNGIDPSVVGDEIDSYVHSSLASAERNHHPLQASGIPTKLCSLLDDDSHDDTTTFNGEEDSAIFANNVAEEEAHDHTPAEHYDTFHNGPEQLDNLHHMKANVHKSSAQHTAIAQDLHHMEASVHKSSAQHIAIAQAPEDPYLYHKEMPLDKHVNQNLNDRFSEVCSPISNYYLANNMQSDEKSNEQAPPSVGVESSVSGSSTSKITDTGNATSKLECPLRDVGETPRSYPPGSDLGDDGEVYHITFYSAKIGLQFQKVPVEKASVGLLTDAMTADLGANRTASDLLRIATISQTNHKNSKSKQLTMECPPVPPVDMVLVCGFVGFDESTGNTRPRIGARLVAFDGITVEVGKWTFESIRKSIHARGRPLTLSFRNDYLTPKQREILTKAVNDVSAHDEPTPKTKTIFRASGAEKNSAILSKSSSVSSNSHKYYSFSEAGSTISSAVAPLMSNLMTGLSAGKKKQEEFTPDYLRRQSSSLDEMRHHQDFKSGLL